MKNLGLILISIIGLAAILSTNKNLIGLIVGLIYMGSINWEDDKVYRQQQNIIYKKKIERLCVFQSGYAPTVSGKMFNLNKYNLALKDTIFDVKKDVVYGAWHSGSTIDDRQDGEAFPELRPNGIRYEMINDRCYVADVILPLTFDHQSHKISVGGADWDQDLYAREQYHSREDFFAYICLRKSCERKPPEPIPPNAKIYDIRDPKENVESFEDKRFPDIILYADPVFEPYQDRSGKKYQEYVFYALKKKSEPLYSNNYTIRKTAYVEISSTPRSQEKISFFKSSAFLDQVKPNTDFYRKISGGENFHFYIDGGSIEVERFSTNVLPIMTDFIHAVKDYPQQFVSEGESQ